MTVAALSKLLGHAFQNKEMRIGPYTDACELLRSIERDDHKFRGALLDAQDAVDSLKALIDGAIEFKPKAASANPSSPQEIQKTYDVSPVSVITDMDSPLYGEAIYTAPQIHELARKMMERVMPGFEQAGEERFKFRRRYEALRSAMDEMLAFHHGSPNTAASQTDTYFFMASKVKDAIDADDAEIEKEKQA